MLNRLALSVGGSVTAAVLLVAAAPAAVAEASPPSRSFLVQSQVFVRTSAGAGARVSIIQVCPPGSPFDADAAGWTETLYFDGFMNAPFPPLGYRFRGTEVWPAGKVSRWQVRSHSAAKSTEVWGFAACLVTVGAGDTSYTGRIKTTVRVWGPVGARTMISIRATEQATTTDAMADLGFPDMDSTSRRAGLTARNAAAIFQPAPTGITTIRARTVRRLKAGRFAEVSNSTFLTTNFHVRPFP